MQLKPVLGPAQLIFYGVGVIIGAGVYSVIGTAAGLAGQSLWISFVIGAVVAFLTGLSYAEMTTAFPTAGAEYVYVRHAVPNSEWASFGIGVIILMGGAATAATVAVSFGGYLKTIVDVPIGLSAFILIAACTGFNIWGLQQSSWVNIVFTSIEVAGLLIVVAAGMSFDGFGQAMASQPTPDVVTAAAVLFFVYLGFEEIANLTEEARNPAHDLPRAIFWSIGITTFLYVAVALAVVNLASPDELAASAAPLAIAIENAWPGAGMVLSWIALFATANTVLVTIIAASRLAFSMGRDGQIPEVFATLQPKWRTPWIATAMIFGMSVVLLPIGDVKILAELSSFAALLAFLAVNVTLVILRFRMPEHPRPFRVPLSVGRMPIPPLVAIASIGVLLTHFDSQIYLAGAIGVGLSVVAFLARHWLTRRGPRPQA